MNDFKLTTLCYLTRGEEILFIVKGNTPKNMANMNAGKYLGVGGHIEAGETPGECAVREIYEESGITKSEISDFRLAGVATFINDMCDDEIMFIYKGEYTGLREPCPGSCDEGILKWVPLRDIYDIPAWEGDREIFRRLFESKGAGTFELKLIYHGDKLIEAR